MHYLISGISLLIGGFWFIVIGAALLGIIVFLCKKLHEMPVIEAKHKHPWE